MRIAATTVISNGEVLGIRTCTWHLEPVREKPVLAHDSIVGRYCYAGLKKSVTDPNFKTTHSCLNARFLATGYSLDVSLC